MKISEIKSCKVETSSVTHCCQLHDDKHKSVQSSEEITSAKQTRHDSRKKKRESCAYLLLRLNYRSDS